MDKINFLIRIYDTSNDMVGYIECDRFNIEYDDGVPSLFYMLHGIWYLVSLRNWNLSAIKVTPIKVVDKNGKN